MLSTRRIVIPAVALVCCCTACSEHPFAPAFENNAPVAPRLDGGHLLGSGAAVDSLHTPTAATTDEAAAGDTTARGGHMLGSGA